MHFSDEHYVKVYSRDTATILAMSWKTRAVWRELLLKVDKSGMLECGPMGADAVALVTRIPNDEVRSALKQLEQLECIRWTGNQGRTLEITNYVEAQEARKTNAQSAREYRERMKAEARADQIRGISETERHEPSSDDRPRHPPSPTPSSSPTPKGSDAPKNGASPPVTQQPLLPLKSGKGTKPPEQRDPRHAELVPVLCASYRKIRGAEYGFTGRDARCVSELLALAGAMEGKGRTWATVPAEVTARWERALLNGGFPTVSSLSELVQHWNHFGGQGAPDGRRRTAALSQQHQPNDQEYDAWLKSDGE